MEKTPRRSTPPTGSVVVDPTSQVPGPPASGRAGAAAAPVRRKPETTVVLQARRVDSLRRQVIERQKSQLHGRRWQVALWALAGAGAVLLGGWLATTLSPTGADRLEPPLVLGRSEGEPGAPAAGPPSSAETRREKEDLDAPSPQAQKGGRYAAFASRPGEVRVGDSDQAGDPGHSAEAASPLEAGERSPDEPKVVGDWGDGFDSAGRAKADRTTTGRSTAGSATSAGRRVPSGSDAVNLDELPTE